MSDQWLCLIDGQKLGPLSFTRLQQLAESGRLNGDDYVRPASDEQWLVAKNIPNLIPAPAVTHDRAESSAPAKRRNSGPLPVAAAIIEPSAAAPAPHRSAVLENVPRGKVVGTPPPVVNAPPAPASSGFPIVTGESRIMKCDAPSNSMLGRKKKNNAMPLMIGGVAVVGVLAILLVLVLSGTIDVSGAGTPVANADTEKKTAPPSATEEFDDEEANPKDTNAETTSDRKTKPARKNANAALTTVKQFLDITKRYRPSKSLPAQVAVTGLWLSASEQGEPYVAPAGGTADKAAKFLVIKLQIDNAPGAAPIDYQGWGDEAVLFDDADQPIEPVPPSKSPEQTAKQRVEPGGSLVDTLVFPLASVEFEKLHLVLPHQTVGIKDAKSFGLELPRHALGRGLEAQVADSNDSPVSAEVVGGKEPQEIIDKAPVPLPQPKPAAAKPKDDDDDILKKLEARAKELDKMEKKK